MPGGGPLFVYIIFKSLISTTPSTLLMNLHNIAPDLGLSQ